MGGTQPAKPVISDIDDLREQLDLGPSVAAQLDAFELDDLVDLERLALLSRLQSAGLPLGARQKVANTLSCAKREGRIGPKPAAPPATPSTADVCQPSPASKAAPPPGVATASPGTGRHCRVWVISDAHSDHKANLEWIKTRLPARRADAFDVCLVAGDVCDNPEVLRESLAIFKARFDEVVFTAGNHDVWVRPKPVAIGADTRTSFDRLDEVAALCAELGVRTAPLWLECGRGARDVLLVPLASWYHETWDREAELPAEAAESDDEAAGGAAGRRRWNFHDLWTDFHLCRWPAGTANGSLELAEAFARRNEPALEALTAALPPAPIAGRPAPTRRLEKAETYALYDEHPHSTGPLWTSVDPATFFTPRRTPRPTQRSTPTATGGAPDGPLRPFIVSLSHMVPRQELLPEKRMLLQPSLHKVSGSDPLEAQIRRLMPDVHAFGHTHLNMDLTLDGVRYVQWPLGTPREQRAQTRVSSFGLMCVYDGARGGETPQHWTHWGRHYEEFERDLSKVARPPYITAIQGSFTGKVKQERSTWGHEQAYQHAAGASSVGTSEIQSRPLASRPAPALLS
jgi:predicted phosphodiesterase